MVITMATKTKDQTVADVFENALYQVTVEPVRKNLGTREKPDWVDTDKNWIKLYRKHGKYDQEFKIREEEGEFLIGLIRKVTEK